MEEINCNVVVDSRLEIIEKANEDYSKSVTSTLAETEWKDTNFNKYKDAAKPYFRTLQTTAVAAETAIYFFSVYLGQTVPATAS